MKGTELTDRIRDEMAAAKNDYVSMMGEMMTEYLRIHPETEIDEKKSLKGAYDVLYGIARKKQKGGCYAMPPREVFGEMLGYYGLPHTGADFAACMMAVIGQTAEDGAAEKNTAIPRKESTDDLFDLDALLGV